MRAWVGAAAALWFGTVAASAAGQGLVALYAFEDNLSDGSGNGRDGMVAAGAPVFVAGRSGYGQAVHITTADSIRWAGLPGTSAVSVSLWVRLDPNSPIDRPWLLDQMASGWAGWQIKPEKLSAATAQVRWMLADAGGARQTTYATTSTLYDGNWHHIVATHNGATTATVYYDGVQAGQMTTWTYKPPMPGTLMTLNNIAQGGITSGDVDDILIYDRALTATEVRDVFNDGVINSRMSVSPGDQTATALEGYGTPAPTLQAYSVTNKDTTASHTIRVSEVDANGNATDYPWLSLSAVQLAIPAGASRSVTPTVTHVSAALTPGVYTARLQFSDDSSPPLKLFRQIQLTVLGCRWSVGPEQIRRYYLPDSGKSPASAVFTVTNTGKHGLSYTVQEVVDRPWLSLNKTGAGPLNYLATSTVTASLDANNLAPGEHSCDIRFTNNCSPAEQVVVRVILAVVNRADRPFVISYYDNGFRSIPVTEVGYSVLAECGMNVVNASLGTSKAPWINPDLAQAFGLKCLIDWDYDGLGTVEFPYDPQAIDTNAQSLATTFGSHPATMGYRLRDEPDADEWPQIGLAHEKLIQYDTDCLPWVNILPNYSYGAYGTGVTSHKKYMDSFMTIVQPRVLCYDDYTVVPNTTYPPDVYPLYWHYSNLERFREYGIAYHVPYWKIIESNLTSTSPNTEGIYRFQVYSALAYGFTGVLYFTYTTQSETSDLALAYYRDQTGAWGTGTSKYPIAQQINREVMKLAPTLSNLRSWDVQFNTPPTFPGTSVPSEDIETFASLNGFYVQSISGGKAVVGNLVSASYRTYLFFVNEDYVNAHTLTIQLNASHVAGLGRVSKSTGRLVLVSTPGSVLTLPLSAGNGELFKVLLDTTAASAPVNVTGTALSSAHISLDWPSSIDAETGVNSYVLYRDGVDIGTSPTSDYLDPGLVPNTTYKYEVAAVNGEGVESTRSAPVWITTLLRTRADYDQDGDVDGADFDHFRACSSGPAVAYAQGCADRDLDADGDVDMDDFGIFQRCYRGADNPIAPSCAN